MATNQLRTELLISAAVEGAERIEQLAHAIEDAGGDASKLREEGARLVAELARLENQQALITQFTRLQEGSRAAAEAFAEAEAKLNRLASETQAARGAVQSFADRATLLQTALADNREHTSALQDEIARLKEEINASGGATDEQRTRLEDLKAALAAAREEAKGYRQEQAEVGRAQREAQRQVDELTRATEAARREAATAAGQNDELAQNLQRVSDAMREAGISTGDLAEQQRSIGESAEAARAELEALTSEAQRLQEVAQARVTLGLDDDDRIREQIEAVTRAYELLRDQGNLTEEELARAAELHSQRLAELEEQLGNLGEAAEKSGDRLEQVISGLGELAAAAGSLTAVINEAVQFEEAMAGVKKVVDATPAQMEALSGTVKELAVQMGLAKEEVAEMAAAGGQLGVAFDDLPQFIELAGQMSIAFGMTADEAGNAAAKLSNVFQIPLSDVRQLGDAINTLGNNTAATENEITEALLRIGGSAKQFGLASEQAAALSAAFISLGKSPEVASTAINAMLNRLQTGGEGVKSFAEGLEDLGLSSKTLAENIKNNPNAALRDFLGRLQELDEQQRAITLTKLFGQEYSDDISLAVGSLKTFDDALALVADKSQTAGAMQKEFQARMDTTAQKIEQAKAAISNLTTSIGQQMLPVVANMAQTVGNAGQALGKFADAHPQLTAFVALLVAAKTSSVAFAAAMTAMGREGVTVTSAVAAGYRRTAAAMATVRAQLAGITSASAAASTAMRGFVASARWLVSNPIGITMIAAASAVAIFSERADSANKSVGDMRDKVDEADAAINKLNAQLAKGMELDAAGVSDALAKANAAAEQSRDAILKLEREMKRFDTAPGMFDRALDGLKDITPLWDSHAEKLAKAQKEYERMRHEAERLGAEQEKLAAQAAASKAMDDMLAKQKQAADAAKHISNETRVTLDNLNKLAGSAAALTQEQVDAVRQSLRTLSSSAAIDEAEKAIRKLRDENKITWQEERDLLEDLQNRTASLGEIGIITASGLQKAHKLTRDEVENLAKAYQKLGQDVPQAYRSMSEAEKEVTEALQSIVDKVKPTADEMQQLLQNALNKIDTTEGVAAINRIYHEWAKTADISETAAQQMQEMMVGSVSRISSGMGEALKTLNLDLQEFSTGISDKAGKALEAFATLAANAGGSTESLARAYAAAGKQVSGSSDALEQLNAKLLASVNGDKQKAEAVKEAAEAMGKLSEAAKSAHAETEKSLSAIGLSYEDTVRGLSAGVHEMTENWKTGMAGLREEGKRTATAVRDAFDTNLAKLKTTDDFKAFHDALQQTGTAAQLGAERMRALRAGMQGGAEAVKALSESLGDNTEAKRQNNEETGKAAEGTKADRDAKADDTEAIKANTEAVKENAKAKGEDVDATEKSTAANKKAGDSRLYLYDKTNLTTEAINNLDDALNRMNSNTILGTQGVIDMWAKQAAAAAQYVADVQKATDAVEMLNRKTSDGTVSMQDIAEATHAASSRIAQLDSATLNNLHSAIDAARQKLADLAQQARDTTASLEAELAQLRGDDSKTAALEQERKLRELNAKLHEAEVRRNDEEIAQYRRAIELQRQIGDEKARQAAAKKAEEQQQRQQQQQQQQQQQTSGNNGRGNSSSGNSRGNGRGYTAAEVADAFDARIAQSRREGRDDFARELHDEMKRRT